MPEKLSVTCPNCRRLLVIPNAPGISDKMLTCPICAFRAKVAIFQQESIGAKKQTAHDEDDETQVNFEAMDRTVCSLYHDHNEYALHKGTNTIGRRAKSSTAEVQISDDMYMSRMHATITVKEGAKGLEHHLKPASPKNPVLVNGKRIGDSDIIFLQCGDRLTFGHTQLLLQRPHYYDEETQQ